MASSMNQIPHRARAPEKKAGSSPEAVHLAQSSSNFAATMRPKRIGGHKRLSAIAEQLQHLPFGGFEGFCVCVWFDKGLRRVSCKYGEGWFKDILPANKSNNCLSVN